MATLAVAEDADVDVGLSKFGIIGNVGRPAFGKRGLFQIIETTLNYTINKHVNVKRLLCPCVRRQHCGPDLSGR